MWIARVHHLDQRVVVVQIEEDGTIVTAKPLATFATLKGLKSFRRSLSTAIREFEKHLAEAKVAPAPPSPPTTPEKKR